MAYESYLGKLRNSYKSHPMEQNRHLHTGIHYFSLYKQKRIKISALRLDQVLTIVITLFNLAEYTHALGFWILKLWEEKQSLSYALKEQFQVILSGDVNVYELSGMLNLEEL